MSHMLDHRIETTTDSQVRSGSCKTQLFGIVILLYLLCREEQLTYSQQPPPALDPMERITLLLTGL